MAKLVLAEQKFNIPSEVVKASITIKNVQEDLTDENIELNYPFSLSSPKAVFETLLIEYPKDASISLVLETANLASYLGISWENNLSNFLINWGKDINIRISLCQEIFVFVVKHLLSFGKEAATNFIKLNYPDISVSTLSNFFGVKAKTEGEIFDKLVPPIVSKITGAKKWILPLKQGEHNYAVGANKYLDENGNYRNMQGGLESKLKFVKLVSHQDFCLLQDGEGDWWLDSNNGNNTLVKKPKLRNINILIFEFSVKRDGNFIKYIGIKDNNLLIFNSISTIIFHNMEFLSIISFGQGIQILIKKQEKHINIFVEDFNMLHANEGKNLWDLHFIYYSYIIKELGEKPVQVKDDLALFKNGDVYRLSGQKLANKCRQIDNPYWLI